MSSAIAVCAIVCSARVRMARVRQVSRHSPKIQMVEVHHKAASMAPPA